jgi:hypothetical protein
MNLAFYGSGIVCEVVGLLNYVTVIPKYLSTLKINYALYLGAKGSGEY